MRRFGSSRPIGVVLGLVVAAGSLVECAESDGGSDSREGSVRARAIVEGAPGSGITGDVTFVEGPRGRNQPEPGVRVVARLRGLTGGRRQGFHIHEKGVCEPPFTSAGGHFDPGPFGNSSPDGNHPFHMGDLPNLEIGKGGIGRLSYSTSRITLSPGPLSLFDSDGSAIVVHRDLDRGIPGEQGASGGPRVACGVIRLRHEG
jgi:superoxide dismutase, Cu-Zn family